AQGIIDEFENQVAGEVLNRGDVAEHLKEAFLEKPFVRLPLHLDEVGHVEDLFDLAKADPRPPPKLLRSDRQSRHSSQRTSACSRDPVQSVRRPSRPNQVGGREAPNMMKSKAERRFRQDANLPSSLGIAY